MHAFPWQTAEFTLMRAFQFSIDSIVARSEERRDAACFAHSGRSRHRAKLTIRSTKIPFLGE
jgi:hypothetical protein